MICQEARLLFDVDLHGGCFLLSSFAEWNNLVEDRGDFCSAKLHEEALNCIDSLTQK